MRTLEGTLGQYKNCMCVGFFMYPLRQMDVSVLASISWCLSLSVPSCPLSLSGRSGKSFLCSGLCFPGPLRKVNERKRNFKKRECERDVGSGNKRWESTDGEERADGYWSKKNIKKKQTCLLKRAILQRWDKRNKSIHYKCFVWNAQKQRNSALRWSLTVKTTFRLFSMSISLGNPLLPQRTR